MMSYLSIGTISLLLTKPRLEKSGQRSLWVARGERVARSWREKLGEKSKTFPVGTEKKRNKGKNTALKAHFLLCFSAMQPQYYWQQLRIYTTQPQLYPCTNRPPTSQKSQLDWGGQEALAACLKLSSGNWIWPSLSRHSGDRDTHLERSEEAQPLSSAPLCPFLGTQAQFTCAFQHNLTENSCVATQPHF